MNSLPADFPTTLQDAIVYFGDPEKAFAAAVALRWPNGITCPRCGSHGALVYLDPQNLVLQGLQKAVHGEGREHLRG